MGLFSSLFGSKTKTKNSFEPYSETKDFLLGNDEKNIPGIFDESARLYGQGGFTDQMQGGLDQYLQQLQGRNSIPGAFNQGVADFTNRAAGDLGTAAYSVANGSYDTNFAPVGNINTPMVNLSSARKSQGVLDPTNSLQNLLSGRVTSPYLQQQADAMTANLTRNLNENVMPNIRSEALASGQYGGSRQGIAEGLVASRLNQDLAPALTNLFGNAYENAQGRMFGTASQLNDQAFQNATSNANRQFSGNQFNANLGLQNNNQQMDQNTQNLNNRMKGLDIAQGGLNMLSGSQQLQQNQNNMQDQNFSQLMGAFGMPQDINWQNLNNYQNVIYPGAQLGGSSKGTQVQTPGIVPAVLGTISGIAGLGRGMGGMSGLSSMFGGR